MIKQDQQEYMQKLRTSNGHAPLVLFLCS